MNTTLTSYFLIIEGFTMQCANIIITIPQATIYKVVTTRIKISIRKRTNARPEEWITSPLTFLSKQSSVLNRDIRHISWG